ncbi:MAG: clostripain-related cysteine peptidase [Rikenellaceae bacterium]
MCALLCIVSCSSDETPYMWVSSDEIRLTYNSGAEAVFSIETNCSWQISMEGEEAEQVTLSQTSGKGTANIKITTSTQNDTKLQIDLADIYITNSNDGSSYTIDLLQRRVPAPQTTLMIFTGTSLKTHFNSNITDIKSAITDGEMGESGRMLYLMYDTSSRCNLYEIVKEEGATEVTVLTLKSYSNISWNDSDTMAQIIEDAKSEAEITSENGNTINLVLSGHGTGWVLKDHPNLTKLAVAGETTSQYSSSMWEATSPLYQMRFMGSATDGFFDIEELQVAIEQSNTKFGYILFDECFMSSIELLYRLRNCSDYIIASPTEVMAAGFPYDRIIKYMFDNDGMDFNVEKICEEYYNSYNESNAPYATIAACVTSELEALAAAISQLDFRDMDDDTRSALQVYEGLSTHVFYDLGDYVTTCGVGDLTNFYTLFDRAFPPACRLHTTRYYSALGTYGAKNITTYYGVSTSAPCTAFTDDWGLEPWTIASGLAN